MANRLHRLASMDRAEALWRGRTLARQLADRAFWHVRRPRWDRSALLRRLSAGVVSPAVRAALSAGRWTDAHDGLSRHFGERPARFVIASRGRPVLRDRILRQFSDSGADAAARAERVVAGQYDLLGYRGLRFTPADSPHLPPDWHFDPVHARRPGSEFWTAVPFLNPACGDHKIIWELNRQQHWLTLGRAYWLTDEARYRRRFIAELHSWLDANPPLTGINWASMLELALRSLSWIWALHLFVGPAASDSGETWTVDLLLGLDRQLTQIERNLSYYFSPNTHLLGEALALYVAGRALPELAASPRREAVGRRILIDEIDRQIAADGGHCERSTHYHRYTLDFYILALLVARITRDAAGDAFEAAVTRLALAARLLADDRGRLPHIGDDDGGALFPMTGRPVDDIRDSLAEAAAIVARPDLSIGEAPEEAWWLLSDPAVPPLLDASGRTSRREPLASAGLTDTGYFVSRSPAGDHVVIDGGAHGYENGGHAHADALALTFTLRGVPLLIDCGTGTYTIDAELRDRLRSTALHNTVVVDDRPQSIPRGPFHWSHVANGHVSRWRTNGGFDYFEGSHDGYEPIVHRRHVLAIPGDALIVADLIAGAGVHRAAAHWHIDPRWHVEPSGRGVTFLTRGDRAGLLTLSDRIESHSADHETGLGWHAPVYGRVEPATTIRVSGEGTAPFWLVSVFWLNADHPAFDVETIPVWAEAGVLAEAVAIRIWRSTATDYVLIAHPARADPAVSWRVGEFETDAHMLSCRIAHDGELTRVALVDGSFVRAAGRRGIHLELPRRVPDLHVDMSGIRVSGPVDVAAARVAGPQFGTRLMVNGRERPIALERRSTQRPRG